MDKTQITFSQAVEGYFIAAHARRLAPGTLTDYDNTFRKFETFLDRDPPLASITPNTIRRFLSSQSALSQKTILNRHVALSALWTWAVNEDIVERHVVRAVKPPRPEKRAIVPYTQADVKAMLAACERSRAYVRPGKRRCDHQRPTAQRDRAIITLLIDTGVRASELCNLRIGDVDFKNHRVLVMGKGRKERILKIDPRTAQVLWRYLVTRDNRRDSDFLFVTRSNRPINRHNLRHTLKRIGERAGVRNVTVHRFRHTFAIEVLRNHPNAYALQEMLGHETLEMVQRYLRLAQADIERAHEQASPVANWRL
jgi:site-specific recombinase XerD